MDVLNTKIKSVLTEKTLKVRPENIKKDVSILGITGTYTSDADATANDIKTGKTAYVNGTKLTGQFNGVDTSDADATAGNILNNKTAYVNGTKLTGSMPNNGSLSYTPSDSSQSIPAGYTSGGTVSATDITTLNDYQTCLEIADEILEGSPEPEYTELSYIQGTGTQYISTDFTPTNNTKIELTMSDLTSSGEKGIMGASTNWRSNSFLLYKSSTYISWAYKRYNDITNDLISKHVISLYRDVVYVDNVNVSNDDTANSNVSINTTLTFFKAGNKMSGYKLYGCKVYENNVLVRDFIPVKDPNNVVCLYDKETETYFYNSGTGNFTPGGEV